MLNRLHNGSLSSGNILRQRGGTPLRPQEVELFVSMRARLTSATVKIGFGLFVSMRARLTSATVKIGFGIIE